MNEPIASLKLQIQNPATNQVESNIVTIDPLKLKLLIYGKKKSKIKNKICNFKLFFKLKPKFIILLILSSKYTVQTKINLYEVACKRLATCL